MGQLAEAKPLRHQVLAMPSVEPVDLDYCRLRYVRYPDDFLLGFTGTKAEAEEIKLCGSRVHMQVHHVHRLADLRRKGRAETPEWVIVIAARQRKTLVVRRTCHQDSHAGRPAWHGASGMCYHRTTSTRNCA